MGRLIKNHWARLIILSAGAYQIAAAIEGFFWPKIFWDFATKTLDVAVKPFPTLQIINLVFGILMMAWEWPLSFIAGSSIHRSLEARLAVLPLAALAAVLTYQGTNAALYYLIAMFVEFWAYSEGEVRSSILTTYEDAVADLALDHLCQAMDITPTKWSCRECIDIISIDNYFNGILELLGLQPVSIEDALDLWATPPLNGRLVTT